MNNEKFIIAKNVKEFIMLLDDCLLYYPKKYFELRNRLVMDSYELLEQIYLANYTNFDERRPIKIRAMMKINILDFYIEESFQKRIISEKQSIRLSKKLLSISKLLRSWIDNDRCQT